MNLKLSRAQNKKDHKNHPKLESNPKNYAYIMEGVGKNDDGDKFWLQNDADYARLHRAAQKHLEEIHKRLDDLLHAHSGLDKE